MKAPIYLDHAASTPLAPEVLESMLDCLRDPLAQGNPSATGHAYGQAAAARIERARMQVATLLCAHASDVVFTSGATESNNLAIHGIARGHGRRPAHAVTSRIEHKSVLDPMADLERQGWSITRVTPDRQGVVSAAAIEAALRPETVFVSLQTANSETGMRQPVLEVGAMCRARGLLLHTDAAQAVGKMPIDLASWPVDLLSFTAHKFYGPKGVGALWVHPAARHRLRPLMQGGGQERGLRSGTLATHQIVALGAAAELAQQRLGADAEHLARLTGQLYSRLQQLPEVWLNGTPEGRLPGILNLSFGGVEGESLLDRLETIAVSTGSACLSARGEPSYVLRALGRDTELTQSSLRFSPGRSTTAADIDQAAQAVTAAVQALRQRAAPLPPPDPPWREGRAGQRSQGTEAVFHIAVDERQVVTAARASVYGCPDTLRTAAWLEEQLPGRKLENLLPGAPADWLELHGIRRDKLGRLLVLEDALKNCLNTAAT
jgi:cysteine desulfurase